MNFTLQNRYRKLIGATIIVWIVLLNLHFEPKIVTCINTLMALLVAPAIAGTIQMIGFLASSLRPKHRRFLLGMGQVAGQFAITLDEVLGILPHNPYAWGTTGHYFELGLVMAFKGDNRATLELLEKCLKRCVKEEGENSKATAETLNILGCAQRDCGQTQDAIVSMKRALAISENAEKKDEILIATLLSDICAAHSRLGQIAEAEETGERALELMCALGQDEIVWGKEHLIAITMNNLGCVYDDLCKYDRAYELYKRSLDLKTRSMGEGDPAIGIAHVNMASQLNNQERFQEAMDHLNKAVEILRKAGHEGTDLWAELLEQMGDAHRGLRNFDEAEKCFAEAIPLKEKLVAGTDVSVAYIHDDYARLLRDKGEHAKAREHWEKAIGICKTCMGEQHPQTKRIERDYSALLEMMGDGKVTQSVS